MRYRFGAFELDPDRFQLCRDGEPIAAEPQVLSLLILLAQAGGRLVTKDEMIEAIWQGRIVSDAAITSRIKSARHLLGDDGQRQEMIQTVRGKGIRFLPEISVERARSRSDEDAGPGDARSLHDLPPQRIRYCRAPDGTGLAYSFVGEGPPLVKTANWLNHLEYEWESSIWRHWLTEFVYRHKLLRYDERGNGMSDWNVPQMNFEAFVDDLETVVDAARFDRFDLFGISQGCAVAIAYAVKHPERVGRMVLYGGFAKGWKVRGDPEEVAYRETMHSAIEAGWGRNNSAFRQLFTSLYFPEATTEQAHWFNEMQRISASPAMARQLFEVNGDIDVSDMLEQVRTPTLFVHSRNDSVVPVNSGQYLAANIPHAEFVELDSANHMVLGSEPAWGKLVQQLRTFLSAE
jgi:pimeloyl-ACP methyl ester carboxylesterase